MLRPRFQIGEKTLGLDQPCFVIAEAGVNHNGGFGEAKRLVEIAAKAGADAVKFQTFQASRLVTEAAPKAEYQKQQTGTSESQLDMLRRLELSREAHLELMAHCQRLGILFLSTPFEEASADLLESLEIPAFKIPSGEITNLPFLAHLARKGRPLILSTGMASLGEVELALQAITAAGNPPVALLHCVSSYPTKASDANLRAMATLAAAFQRPVGYSDHTEGIVVPLAAAALGACIIEKHFTLDRSLPGPDQQTSLEPAELETMIQGIRRVESALGHGLKIPAPCEANTAAIARKSIVAARDIPAGTKLTQDWLTIKRPGTGLPPSLLPHITGRCTCRAISRDALLSWEDLA
ncbi:MAG TPA: N-acetylneuraminate synthase [Holophaga sp.]|nr:N-acetylneuraminate synthase [Holophaga sp.]